MAAEAADIKTYEVSFLVKDETAAGKALELIGRHASVATPGPLRRLTFAYPVEKETAGFFGVVRAEALPAAAKQLEHDLKVSREVLRSLVLRTLVEKTPAAGSQEATRQKPRVMPRPRTETRPAPAPLSNEALSKKIEEILQ